MGNWLSNSFRTVECGCGRQNLTTMLWDDFEDPMAQPKADHHSRHMRNGGGGGSSRGSSRSSSDDEGATFKTVGVASGDNEGDTSNGVRYRKLHTLGQGRLAKVVLCEQISDGSRFAMKCFRRDVVRRERWWDEHAGSYRSALSLISEEIALMRRLRHPNVIEYLGVVDDPARDRLWVAMEYLEGGALLGGTLKRSIDVAATAAPLCEDIGVRWVALDEACARLVLRDVVCGLAYLHARGVVHQDIKPDNILIASDGSAKIADFGVAQLVGYAAQNALLVLESSAGTPAFRAPETHVAGAHSGRCADVWSLGVTLYAMLCGRLPFVCASSKEMAGYDQVSVTGESSAFSADAAMKVSIQPDQRKTLALEKAICNQPLRFPESARTKLGSRIPHGVMTCDGASDRALSPSIAARKLLEGMLCKVPAMRITLAATAADPWVTNQGVMPPVEIEIDIVFISS